MLQSKSRSDWVWHSDAQFFGFIFAIVVVVFLIGVLGDSGSGSGIHAVTVPIRPALEPTTCKKIIPDILTVTTQLREGEALVGIYRPKTVVDRIADFNSGRFKIPASKNMIEVLGCTGQVALRDGSTAEITYQIKVDTNDDCIYGYSVHRG